MSGWGGGAGEEDSDSANLPPVPPWYLPHTGQGRAPRGPTSSQSDRARVKHIPVGSEQGLEGGGGVGPCVEASLEEGCQCWAFLGIESDNSETRLSPPTATA